MKNEKYLEILTKIGLSENESRAYLASLSLGPSTVLNISRKSGVQRSSLYYIIENLKKKNLIIEELRGFKTLYLAQSPQYLKTVFDDNYKEFNRFLPDLESIYNVKGNEDSLRRYEGVEQIKSVYEYILKVTSPNDYYYVFSNTDKFYAQDPEFFIDFVQRRAKLKLHTHLLLEKTKISLKQKALEKNYNTKVKYLPEGTKLDTNLVITPNILLIQEAIPPYRAMTSNNRYFIETYRQMFEALWDKTE